MRGITQALHGTGPELQMRTLNRLFMLKYHRPILRFGELKKSSCPKFSTSPAGKKLQLSLISLIAVPYFKCFLFICKLLVQFESSMHLVCPQGQTGLCNAQLGRDSRTRMTRGLDGLLTAPYSAGIAVLLPGPIPGFCRMLHGIFLKCTSVLGWISPSQHFTL